jgi:hypothetical protein
MCSTMVIYLCSFLTELECSFILVNSHGAEEEKSENGTRKTGVLSCRTDKHVSLRRDFKEPAMSYLCAPIEAI